MLETPEVEAHHHKTGHSRADLILALLAVALSGTSIFIAVGHGRTMERLVAANSWPNLSISSSNVDDHDTTGQKGSVRLDVKNTGVGPARIDTVELFYKGVPQTDPKSFLQHCCTKDKNINFYFSTLVDDVLPARESLNILTLPKENPPAIWDALNAARFETRLRICYCSVFDECFVADMAEHRPKRVAECIPSQPVTFR